MAMAKSIVAFLVALSLATAEYVDVHIPRNFNLSKPAAILFIYAKKDAPHAYQNATVTFSNFAFDDGKEYEGIELNLIRYEDAKTQELAYTCCGQAPFEEPLCKTPYTAVWWVNQNGTVMTWKVKKYVVSKNAAEPSQTIEETGMYALKVTDCGPEGVTSGGLFNVSITGLIELQNPFGYLPGHQYYKLPLYGVLVLTYAFLTCCWIILCLRHYQALLRVQTCMLAVLLMGLVEVSVWYLDYKRWNDRGREQPGVLHVAVFASVIRASFSYMLALVCAMGWGVTRPSLGRSVFLQIACLCFIYIPLDFARRLMMSFRELPLDDNPQNKNPIMFSILLLYSIMSGIIFYWVFNALNNSIDDLMAQKQTEKAKLFHKLWYLLIAALFVMTAGQVGEIWMLTVSSEVHWRYLWIIEDTVGHFDFLFVLFCQMVLWRPHRESHRFAYTFQLQSEDPEDDDPPVAPVSDAFDIDDEDDFDIDPGDIKEKLGLQPFPTKMGAADP